jgi:hypothetical protein
MAGRQTTAELHAFVRQLLVDALRAAVRNDNGMPDPENVSPEPPTATLSLSGNLALRLLRHGRISFL